MVLKPGYPNPLLLALVCLLLLFSVSCGSKARYAGLYKAQESESYIELKENGEGVWRVKDNEDSFSWYVKGDEIRINTKAGGIIVANIQEDDTLEVTLPGGRKMSFKRIE